MVTRIAIASAKQFFFGYNQQSNIIMLKIIKKNIMLKYKINIKNVLLTLLGILHSVCIAYLLASFFIEDTLNLI